MMLSSNLDEINKELNKGYEILNEYKDVPGLIELRELLEGLRYDESFKFIAKNLPYDLTDECLECKNKYKFFKQIHKVLSDIKALLHLQVVSFSSFVALCSIMTYSCAYNYGRDLSNDEKIEVLRSNLHCKISLGLDNFADVENYKDVNKEFFKKLSSIKWDKRCKKLESTIHDLYIFQFSCLHHMDSTVVAEFALCSRYLACCICLYKNKSHMTSEDLISAWILTFKLLHSDLRPYIFDIGEDEKVF